MLVAFFNPQGNFDHKDSYWAAHPDFGGQLVYVKEVAIELASLGVDVDIVTRRIEDSNWPEFSGRFDYYPDVENVRIIRIDFGGKKFLTKEELWPYLGEYIENMLVFYKNESRLPNFVTSHYGDGGIAGAIFSMQTNIPYSFAAHSLGAQKLDRLLGNKWEKLSELNTKFKFSTRIIAERVAMKYSCVNITNSRMERFEQYGHSLYKGWIDANDNKKFAVIPPGVNPQNFNTHPSPEDDIVEREVLQNMISHIKPERHSLPWVVLSSRIESKKNHITLVKAYALDKHLQSLANVLIVTRGIDNVYQDYKNTAEPERSILENLVRLIDRSGLKDKVFFINIEGQKKLASLYNIAAKRHSVFTLTSVYEPFGLAVIEAMACGLPVVATKNGGTSEILQEDGVEYGKLVDPEDPINIAEGLSIILGNTEIYSHFQKLGLERVKSKYNWKTTASKYFNIIQKKMKEQIQKPDIPKFFLTGKNPPAIKLKVNNES